ncbi:unnamed protein product, partial [Rotaria socialis]
ELSEPQLAHPIENEPGIESKKSNQVTFEFQPPEYHFHSVALSIFNKLKRI